ASQDGTVFTAFLRDISERKRARETEELYSAIVKSSSDAITSKTLDGIITTWNTAAEHIYGYTRDEAIGQSISMVIPPDLMEDEAHLQEQIRNGQRVNHYETERIRKDGTRIHVSMTASPIMDAQDHIIGASVVARDITDRKETEEAMRFL